MASTRDLITTRYDKADRELDKLEATACGLASMLDSYSDRVANGVITILFDACSTLREWTGDAREALAAADAKGTNPDTDRAGATLTTVERSNGAD